MKIVSLNSSVNTTNGQSELSAGVFAAGVVYEVPLTEEAYLLLGEMANAELAHNAKPEPPKPEPKKVPLVTLQKIRDSPTQRPTLRDSIREVAGRVGIDVDSLSDEEVKQVVSYVESTQTTTKNLNSVQEKQHQAPPTSDLMSDEDGVPSV